MRTQPQTPLTVYPARLALLGDQVKHYRLLIGATVALGLVFRARHLLLGRSLWLDEAFLATAVIQRTLGALLVLPLPYEQTPPPMFLILAKLLSDAAGPTEMVLRAVPFVCGCLALCLFPLFSRRHSQTCVLLGTLLLALSQGAVYYSAEFKPYSTESMLSVVFILAGIRFLEENISKASALGLGLVFVLGPWLSFTTVFLLAGLFGGLLLAKLGRDARPQAQAWAILGAGLASFMAMYLLYAKAASTTQLHMDYWKTFYVPANLSPEGLAWHVERASLIMAHYFGFQGFSGGAFLAGLTVLGGIWVIRRDPPYGLMLALPLVVAALVSLFERFPLHERLLVFTLPICCLMLAEGVMALGSLPGRLGRAAGLVSGGVLLLILARPTAGILFDPGVFERQEFKQLYEEVLRRRSNQDVVFVFQTAIPAFEYYRQLDPRLADFKSLSFIRGDADSLEEAIRTARQAKQGWVLFSHRMGFEEQSFTRVFETQEVVRDRVAVKGAWAFAFCPTDPKILGTGGEAGGSSAPSKAE